MSKIFRQKVSRALNFQKIRAIPLLNNSVTMCQKRGGEIVCADFDEDAVAHIVNSITNIKEL